MKIIQSNRAANVRAQYQSNHSAFLCNCSNISITRRVVSNGTVQYTKQCDDCGKKHGVISHEAAKLAGGSTREYDTELRDRGVEENQARYYRELSVAIKADKADWFRQYDQYLASEEWRQRRWMVLKRCGHTCEGCGMNRAVQVHHLTYDHVGEEFLWELVGICEPCHVRIHPHMQLMLPGNIQCAQESIWLRGQEQEPPQDEPF